MSQFGKKSQNELFCKCNFSNKRVKNFDTSIEKITFILTSMRDIHKQWNFMI